MTLPLVVLAAMLAMMVVEARRPAVALPTSRGWWPRAIAASAFQAAVVVLAAPLWDGWLRAHALLDGAALGTSLGALVGYVVITFVYYGWHRARHEVPFLWRWFHQLHHSPTRLEVVASFYKHPFEILANGLLSSAVLYGLLGMSLAAAASATLLTGLAELVYHWNVRTPRWLGYLFQRPEMHRLHHAEGVHGYNYADLPLWDLLFGTFRNPATQDAPMGFGADAEQQVGAMLRGVDLGAPAGRSRDGAP
ncbi:MAG: sterol desaturase family protein [Myxococcota bacterium]